MNFLCGLFSSSFRLLNFSSDSDFFRIFFHLNMPSRSLLHFSSLQSLSYVSLYSFSLSFLIINSAGSQNKCRLLRTRHNKKLKSRKFFPSRVCPSHFRRRLVRMSFQKIQYLFVVGKDEDMKVHHATVLIGTLERDSSSIDAICRFSELSYA